MRKLIPSVRPYSMSSIWRAGEICTDRDTRPAAASLIFSIRKKGTANEKKGRRARAWANIFTFWMCGAVYKLHAPKTARTALQLHHLSGVEKFTHICAEIRVEASILRVTRQFCLEVCVPQK